MFFFLDKRYHEIVICLVNAPFLPARRRATALRSAGQPGRKRRFRLYEQFMLRLTEDLGRSIQTGKFGADMKVSLTNDGPVTIIIDSRIRE